VRAVDGWAALRLTKELADRCEKEQLEAEKLNGCRDHVRLARRDRHVARAGAFLEAAELAKEAFGIELLS
jgi:hypothetical protein